MSYILSLKAFHGYPKIIIKDTNHFQQIFDIFEQLLNNYTNKLSYNFFFISLQQDYLDSFPTLTLNCFCRNGRTTTSDGTIQNTET